MKTPTISKELVDWLEKTFPNRCPKITETDREVWVYVGKQELIEHIRSLYLHQSAQLSVLEKT